MSHPRHRGWTGALRHLAVPALAVAVITTLPLSSGADPAATPDSWTPLAPVSLTLTGGLPAGRSAHGKLLAFNDFHGAIDPPTGNSALVNGAPAGGVEYLATTVKKLRAAGETAGQDVVTVGAGDMVGASPLVSAAFHDEPTIELLSALGLDITSVGNHEFDEGVTELKRLQYGGCHPTDGCFAGDGFDGAGFQYLSANVVDKHTKLPILPPVTVKIIDGVPVGFVGLTLKGTPGIVNPAGITSVEFQEEIETANKWGSLLRLFGVKAQVLLIHEGGAQGTGTDVSSCAAFAGVITPIVAGLRSEFGVVVSGHTHRFYSCSLPNAAGAPVVVTSAGTNGMLVTDIDVTLDKSSRSFTRIDAHNVIVENGIRNADGSWQQTAPGVYKRNDALVDAATKVIADKYRIAVAPLANRVVGKITGDISRDVRANGESPLGDVIADAQLAYTAASAGAQIALMNPGGIRAPFTYANSPGGEPVGDVTYGECFTVQPFNNLVVTQTFTGAQLKEVLEQQFAGYAGQGATRILQVSAGFTYSYNNTLTLGSRVSDLKLDGTAIDPATSYQVTTNDFLANGGDGFTKLTFGTGRTTAPGFDVDALVAHVSAAPVAPGTADRITKLG